MASIRKDTLIFIILSLFCISIKFLTLPWSPSWLILMSKLQTLRGPSARNCAPLSCKKHFTLILFVKKLAEFIRGSFLEQFRTFVSQVLSYLCWPAMLRVAHSHCFLKCKEWAFRFFQLRPLLD